MSQSLMSQSPTSQSPMNQSLGQLPWMTAPATAAVLDALEAAGGPDCARFVGGCVRNALIGQPIADVDVATTLTPDQATRALNAAGVRAIPTGIDHGTVTAVSGHQPFEVTTLRRDVETDGRRAVVAFTTDWMEDALRRDFTLNSLYARRDGSIFDPTGHGVADARAGRIVFVGDPEQRLREDYLRALRFFRFLAWYGRGAPDAAAVAAITQAKDNVARLAAERISAELMKLLAAPDPRPAMRLMAQTGVLAVVLPGPLDMARFEGLVGLERELGEVEPLLRLAALLPDDPDQAVAAAERLRLSNAERDRLADALCAPAPDGALSLAEARAMIYRLGAKAFRDRLKLAWARRGGEGWRELRALVDGWTPPRFPLGGADVMAAGVARGPEVGRVLRLLENWWIEQDFGPDRQALLDRLAHVAQGSAP